MIGRLMSGGAEPCLQKCYINPVIMSEWIGQRNMLSIKALVDCGDNHRMVCDDVHE